jgi:Peptidase family C25
LLLGGDASLDPRDYLGTGFFDFVPTRIIPTSELKTASDDWFSDFNDSGLPTIATGRMPARTTGDMQIMVQKSVSYQTGQAASWNNQALLVADQNDSTLSFTAAAQAVQNLLPSTITPTDVFVNPPEIKTDHQNILSAVNNGALLVNYNGHGSVEVWSGSGLFDDSDASTLTNGDKLPLFVIMNCLNGFFHDVFTVSMATSLMLSPNGGAAAVWASSGLTPAQPQFQMDQSLVRTLFTQPNTALGDAVVSAKSTITDQDVRKTFILFGDPLMQLKVPQNTAPPGASSVLEKQKPQNIRLPEAIR